MIAAKLRRLLAIRETSESHRSARSPSPDVVMEISDPFFLRKSKGEDSPVLRTVVADPEHDTDRCPIFRFHLMVHMGVVSQFEIVME